MEQPAVSAKPMSFMRRLIGIYVNPRATFESLRDHPTWAAPLLLLAGITGVVNFFFLRSEAGQAALRETMEASGRTIPAERMEQALRFGWITGSVGGALFWVIMIFVVAGLVYLLFNILSGGQGSFKQVLAATSHASLVHLLGTALRTPLVVAQQSFQVAFSPVLFLPDLDPKSFAYRALNTLDIFQLWSFLLLAIGLSVVYGTSAKRSGLLVFGGYFLISLGIIALIS